MSIDASILWTFLLVFVRITTFMVTAPLFSGRQVPTQYKIGFSVFLSILCVGLVKEPVDSLPESTIVLLILKEFLVGIILGLVGNILLYAVQMAGSIMDVLIGFSMASLFDPTFGTSAQLTGRMQNAIALLVLLATNGHHLLIKGILSSFDWISLQTTIPAFTDGKIATFLLECLQQMFLIGFMMAAPIIGTLFVVDVALGIIARTVPQMNLFAVFPPMKILIHFLIYIFVLPSFFYLLKVLFENMFGSMYSIMKLMGV
ncbi:flagellar biosynthetic protein FliR [Bacillus sp. SORGH_AS 510]|uniref:flagellar biosynthetic protein FliR n=1 Tax=Bacillus sp. SORGH_AS_0510 TaxID=3041771 RepID=UPI002785E8A8|nr:flagellar biosynthetic protein FliR [Bacillus sp. SORGH_AS_0510]MDQ1146272.1 flagellar biosynthetic protein FliR [Bacillus sp. SORGH_AS_0510]